MHLIASHQGRPADDPIFALNKEATQRKARGEAIVNATVGALLDDDGQLAILQAAAKAVHDVPAVEWATYAPIAGTPDFLRAVIDDLLGGEPSLRDCAVATATPGGSGALRLAITNFLEPGQALLTTSWYWGPYHTLCDESERRLETFNMFTGAGRAGAEAGGAGTQAGGATAAFPTGGGGAFPTGGGVAPTGPGATAPTGGLDIEAFDAALGRQLVAQGRALVFLNDPAHNPTGYSMTDDEWRAVVERISRRASQGAVTLLVDCAYFLFGGARDPRAFLAHLRPLVGKAGLLFAWSASKSFTQYGLRVGALIACVSDPGERAMVESALSYSCRGTWSNCNRGGLTAVTRMLVDPDTARACSVERAALAGLLRQRVDAFNALARGRDLRYPRYEGGFFVTVFHDRAAEKAEAMRAKGVYVVPQLPRSGGGALRVALCSVAERDIARLVDALG
jgi:aromatic-amino-acid transaminase